MSTTSTDISCSLFYVDDDQDDLELFKEVADSIGESVCVFEYGDLMLYTLNNPPPSPSIIFVDLNMPTMNGFEVVQEIRRTPHLAHLPVIVYSTAASHHNIDRCKKLGVSLFVTKPTSISGIGKVIKHVVGIDWNEHDVDKDFIYRA